MQQTRNQWVLTLRVSGLEKSRCSDDLTGKCPQRPENLVGLSRLNGLNLKIYSKPREKTTINKLYFTSTDTAALLFKNCSQLMPQARTKHRSTLDPDVLENAWQFL
jgi:hypothetical protein